MQAFREMEMEQKLMKTAALRGVSVKDLKKTAKNFNLATKCSRSVYKKPFDALKHKKSGMESWIKQNKTAQYDANKKKI